MNWLIQLQSVPNSHFAHLVRARGMTGMDAARLARESLIAYGATPGGRSFLRWQDAWNHLTGAEESKPGKLLVRSPQCPTCSGKGYVFRGNEMVKAMTRGLPQGTCPDCRGSRVAPSVTMVALYAP